MSKYDNYRFYGIKLFGIALGIYLHRPAKYVDELDFRKMPKPEPVVQVVSQKDFTDVGTTHSPDISDSFRNPQGSEL